MSLKDIPGYEGLYAATEDGSIWSRTYQKWHGTQVGDKAGHLIVILSKNNKPRTWGVHQLVLLTFVGPCPEGLEACHNNNIGSDNRLSNLRYDTHQSNMLESAQQNRDKIARGEKINTAKLTESEVRIIRGRFRLGEGLNSMAPEYGISYTAIWNIVHNKTWKHVREFAA